MSEQPRKCTPCWVKMIFAFFAGVAVGSAGAYYGPCPPPSKPVPAAVADDHGALVSSP